MENAFKTRQEIIYDSLKEKIITGVYQPGQRLVANDLAEELNVSRMPVREALSRLANTGLVELIPYKGAIVNKLTAKDYVEIFHIRAVLEGLAARLACDNMTNDDYEQMQAANEEAWAMLINEDDSGFQRVNREFHSTIWRRTNSTRLQTLLSNLHSEAAQYRHMTVILPARYKEVCEEHDCILAALRKRDAKLAESCVGAHYENTLKWLVKLLEEKE